MSDASIPALHFRAATAADRPRLITLINAAFSIETFLEGTRTDDERLSAMMQKGEILLAENSERNIVASIYTELRGRRGYLGMLAVESNQQRRGLGQRLLAVAEARFRAQGCEAVDITVLSQRTELPPIYRRFGFVETGREAFHSTQPLKVGEECHSIIMSKPL